MLCLWCNAENAYFGMAVCAAEKCLDLYDQKIFAVLVNEEWTVTRMAKRWVKYFASEFPSDLSEKINKWLACNPGVTLVGISTFAAGTRLFCAEVILEMGGR